MFRREKAPPATIALRLEEELIAPPAGAGQFQTVAPAKTRRSSDTVIRANTKIDVYPFAGTQRDGATKQEAPMGEAGAKAANDCAAENEKYP